MLRIQNILGVHERHVNSGKELVKWLSIIPPHFSPQKQLSSSPKYNSFNHIHHYSQQFLSSSHKHLPLKSMSSPILNNHWHNSNLPVYPSLKKTNSPFPRSCGLPVSRPSQTCSALLTGLILWRSIQASTPPWVHWRSIPVVSRRHHFAAVCPVPWLFEPG